MPWIGSKTQAASLYTTVVRSHEINSRPLNMGPARYSTGLGRFGTRAGARNSPMTLANMRELGVPVVC